jgi:hypothetical protein
MRIHFILNNGGTPESKLADVEIHFEDGILSGLKLVGCSVWRSKKGEDPTVLVPSRSYATAGGIRYFELLRAGNEGANGNDPAGRLQVKAFRDYVRDEYLRVVSGTDKGAGI